MSRVLKNCILPFFPGFYGSIFDIGDIEYYQADSEYEWFVDVIGDENAEKVNLSPNDFKASKEQINEYMVGICESFVEAVNDYLPEWVENIKYVGLDSPRYYNYRNDEIICDITLSNGWEEMVEEFIKEYKEELREDIKEQWSSLDGFLSFVNNNVDEWLEEIYAQPEKYLPILLSYNICYSSGKSCHDIIEDLCSAAYEDNNLELSCTNEEANKLFYEMR